MLETITIVNKVVLTGVVIMMIGGTIYSMVRARCDRKWSEEWFGKKEA